MKCMNVSWILIAAAALAGMAGCETTPETSGVLDEARAAVSAAETDPNVARHAASELDRARKLLVNAEGVAKEKGAKDEAAAHYAYLATQMARISQQRAQEQVATTRVKSSETERQKILLSAQAESQRLAALLENLQASQTPRGIVLTLDDVLFDTGKAQLKSGADRPIEQITGFLRENPERRVQIEGFTDSLGTDDYNIELSQSRADAVAMAIIQRGIDAQRVRALGYGEGFPVAGNEDAGSRQLNRRVEIIVSDANAEIPGRMAGSP